MNRKQRRIQEVQTPKSSIFSKMTVPDLQQLAQGVALQQAGNLDDAEKIYQTLHVLYPSDATLLHLLGLVHIKRGNLEEGVRLLDRAITINPGFAEAYEERAIALKNLGNYEKALANYERIIALKPAYAAAYYNQGQILLRLERYDEALVHFDKAIELKPDYAEAYNSRGNAFKEMQRYDEALRDYDKAITYSYADAFFNKGLLKLLLGEFEEGWLLYEWRWKINNWESIVSQKPLWLGKEPLVGKTIVLHQEQGAGDAIQLCRYVPMVEALGAKVILGVRSPLSGLMSRLDGSFRIWVDTDQTIPEFDLQCPLLSLPLAFGTTIDTIPANIPYLSIDLDKRKTWQERLGKKVKPRIGLVWSGASGHYNDHNRSIHLNLFTNLLQKDFEFHSLQKEIRKADKEFLIRNGKIKSHAEALIDFDDTAALIAEMDLVISVDTSVAHLAGALSKPVWILLPFVPDFRWLTEREDSPWYPTARLFRQEKTGDWDRVMAKVRAELQHIQPENSLK